MVAILTPGNVPGAPRDAQYYLGTADSELANGIDLGALTTGILKHTVSGGASTPATAVEGTDYYGPSGTDVAVADGGTGASTSAGARTNLGAQEDLSGATISSATVATGDKVLIQDVDDSDNLKTVTAQSIADLAAGGGGITLLETLTANNTASTLTSSAISSSYKDLLIYLKDIVVTTDGDLLYFQVSGDVSGYLTTGTYAYGQVNINDPATVDDTSGGDSGCRITSNATNKKIGNAAGEEYSGWILIRNYASDSPYKLGQIQSGYKATTGSTYLYNINHCILTDEAINGFKLVSNAATNLVSGTVQIYGVS